MHSEINDDWFRDRLRAAKMLFWFNVALAVFDIALLIIPGGGLLFPFIALGIALLSMYLALWSHKRWQRLWREWQVLEENYNRYIGAYGNGQ